MGDILEDDSLPDPTEFLPPTEGFSPDLFRPNQARAEVFKGLTFIFMDKKQYGNLVLPINAGQGKAVQYDPTNERVEELVKFASNKGQVILIQRNFDPRDELCLDAAKQYAPFYYTNVRLGYESITQSDFLAPVLLVDRSSIVKPMDVSMQRTLSTPTLGHSQRSPSTLVGEHAPTVIPDSVERPKTTQQETQIVDNAGQMEDVMDIPFPTPVRRKVRPLSLLT
jgi:hypothetical protein